MKSIIYTCFSKLNIRNFRFVGSSLLLFFLLTLQNSAVGQQYNVTLPQQCNFVTGGTEIITFTNTPVGAVSSGTLDIQVYGDLDIASSEFLSFYNESNVLMGTTTAQSPQCTGKKLYTFTLSQSDLNLWAGSGNNIQFTVVAAPSVNNNLAACNLASFCIEFATLTYTAISGPNNAGVIKIDSPSNYCPGTLAVKATIGNFGNNRLDSVRVNWTFNGAPRPTIFYTSPLDTIGGGTSQVTLTLGNEVFVGGNVYTIKVWTSFPNGVQDTSNQNDTLSKPVTNLPNCPLDIDVGVSRFVSPSSYGCDFSDSTQICVTIRNYGLLPQSNIPVSFKIFSVVVATEIVPGPVNPGDSIQYCFNKTVDLSLPDLYPFSAYTSMPGEMKTSNDSVGPYPVQTAGIRSTFPYLVTFEEQPGAIPQGWVQDPGNNEPWKFSNGLATGTGAPDNVPVDHTTGNGSGYFAWVDNSSPNSSLIGLNTQCLDFTNLANPFMEFYMWNSDPANSINLFIDVYDNGKWNQIAGPFGYQGATDWGYKLLSLAAYAGKSVKVRFRASESGTATTRDLAIDDVKFFNIGPINFKTLDLLSPISKCNLTDIEQVTVRIQQLGYQTIPIGTVIPISFQSNGGLTITENLTLTDSLQQFDSAVYTFNAPINMLNPGDYFIRTWTAHPQDDDATNDTLNTTVANILVDQFPAKEDFSTFVLSNEALGYRNFWSTSPANSASLFRWNVGTGLTPTANTGPLGDHTSLDGKYLYTEADQGSSTSEAYVYSPCYDLGQLTNPGLNFWYNMYGTGIGELHLDAIIDTSIFLDIMPAIIGNKGQGWKLAAVPLDNFANEVVSFRFRAKRGTNTVGDMAIDDFIVGELPSVNLPDTVTNCGQVLLDAGVLAASYLWSTGGTDQKETIPGNATDTVVQKVTLMITNSSGLSVMDSTVAVVTPGPYVNLGPDTLVCGQTSLVLDAGNPGMIYLWNDNTTGQTKTVTTSGTYFVRVADSKGCLKVDTIHVTFGPAAPTGSFTFTQTASYVMNFNSTVTSADSVIWDFGDGYFSYINNPSHFFAGTGTYQVRLIVKNICGADTIITNVTVIDGVGITDPAFVNSIEVSPNPTNGNFTVEMYTGNLRDIQISIVNIQGQEILVRKVENAHNKVQESFNLSDLAKGIYFVKINSGVDVSVKKLVIQ